MYVPVESVYYELACGKTGALLQYAHEKRVFPVSPTTFTAYLQVIVLGLRGMQIEQRAQEVMGYVAELKRDFGKFTEDFDLVGNHLGARRRSSPTPTSASGVRRQARAGSEDVDETIELEELPPPAIEAA